MALAALAPVIYTGASTQLKHRVMTLQQILAKPFIWLIRGYQLAISPMLGSNCRFYPTCSSYMLQAIERFGLLKGIGLGLMRLAKCHPWHSGGVDLVPEKNSVAKKHDCGCG